MVVHYDAYAQKQPNDVTNLKKKKLKTVSRQSSKRSNLGKQCFEGMYVFNKKRRDFY